MRKRSIWALMVLAAAVLLCAAAAADTITVDTNTVAWTDGNTYEVSGDVTISSRVLVTGNVHLQLNAGCSLTCSKGISVFSGNTLTIDGSGSLTANATGLANAAGIGGFKESDSDNRGNGTVIINGGTIIANGGDYGAGIGGGLYGNGGTTTINGGHVTAKGGTRAAGIGGGGNQNWANNYGNVNSITINGGTVIAQGKDTGAGIGGGGGATSQNTTVLGGWVGTITINGGMVEATGGNYGYGIGPGYNVSQGQITLGWTNPGDYIKTSGYAGYGGTVSFAAGKQFRLENGEGPVGLDGIGGQKIVPYIDHMLYDVTVSGTIEHGTVTADPVSAEAETTITLTVAPDEDYEVESLTVTGPDGAITVTGGQFTMPAGSVTVSAAFRRCMHTVTIAATEHGTVTADPASAQAGTTVTLTVAPDEDYEVESLTVTGPDGEITVTDGQFTMPAGDVTVSAAFRRCIHTVVTAATEHGAVTANPASAEAGQTITLTVTPDEGYEPDSLTVTGPDGEIAVTDGQFTMPAGDVTVSSAFMQKSFNVSIVTNRKDNLSVSHKKAHMGETITVAIYETFYWVLDSLTVTGPNGEITVTDNRFTMPAGDVTVNAAFRNVAVAYTDFDLISGTGTTCADLLNANSSSPWHESGRNSFEVVFQSRHYIVPKSYTLRVGAMASRQENCVPTDWTLEARRTLSDEWTTLASVSGDTTVQPVNYAEYTFPLNNSAEYRYFRFRITKVRSGHELVLSGLWFNTPSAESIPNIFITQRYGTSSKQMKCRFEDSFVLGRTAFTEEGKYLDSWNTQQDGGGTSYTVYESLTAAEDAEYWAMMLPRNEHAIHVNVTGPGRVTVSGTAVSGDAVPFTWAVGEDGGKLVSLTVTGPDGAVLPVENGSFFMPGGDVTISAVFKANDFIVLPGENVSYTYEDGVLSISGTGDCFVFMQEGSEPTTDRIELNGSVDIHLDNVNIDVSGTEQSALSRTPNTNYNFTLYVSGTNVLRSGAGQYGVNARIFHLKESGSGGVLYVYGGEGSEAIPYGFTIDSGTIHVCGGEGADGMGDWVTVNGGALFVSGVNGIGKEASIFGGKVTITADKTGIGPNTVIRGGTVTVTGGETGIGPNVTITGGSVTAEGGVLAIGANCSITGGYVTARGVNGGDGFGDGLSVNSETALIRGEGRYGAAGGIDITIGKVILVGTEQALGTGTLNTHSGQRCTTVKTGINETQMAASPGTGYEDAVSLSGLTDQAASIECWLMAPGIVLSDDAAEHLTRVSVSQNNGSSYQTIFESKDASICDLQNLIPGGIYRMEFNMAVTMTPSADPAPAKRTSYNNSGKFVEEWQMNNGTKLTVDVDYESSVFITYLDDNGLILDKLCYVKGENVYLWNPRQDGKVFNGWTLNGEPAENPMTLTDDVTLTATWTVKPTYPVTAVNCIVRDKQGNIVTSAYEGQYLYVDEDSIEVPDNKYCSKVMVNGTAQKTYYTIYMPGEALTVEPILEDLQTVTIDLRNGASYSIDMDNDETFGYLFDFLQDHQLNENVEGNTYLILFDVNEDGTADLILSINMNDYAAALSAGEGAAQLGDVYVVHEKTSPIRYVLKLAGADDAVLMLPADTRTIEEYAFQGIAAASVYVPDDCATIGAYAFSDCDGLILVRLPKNCAFDNTIFAGCGNRVVIRAPEGGTTQNLAETYDIPFEKE